MLEKCKLTTPLSELLLDRGITYVKDKKVKRKMLLLKDGKELGYFTAQQAHDKFII